MSRFVLGSNNLWLVPLTDKTIMVTEGPYFPDLNTHNVPKDIMKWRQVARIGSNSHCTHRELEVFGVVFGGKKLEQLRSSIVSGLQRFINREGFAVTWLNRAGGTTSGRPGSVYRRLNDLYDWSRQGVKVPIPLQTEWDRFELITGKLMVGAGGGGGGSAQMKKEMEEKENQKLQASKDKEIEELKKQAKEKDDRLTAKDKELAAKDKELAANKENEKRIQELEKQAKDKDDQLAAKDKQIGNLRSALAAFT